MKLFVAGKSGQVALSLADVANEFEADILFAGRPDYDLTNEDAVRQAIDSFEPDAILNAAAYTAVDAAETDEKTAFAINADGAALLARAAADHKIPFLHLSTDYVFDGTKNGAYSEEDQPAPTGVYGKSKLAGERLIQDINPDALIFRTAWVYSPHGKNFLKTMLTLAESRTELGVVGDQVGNPTYAPDIACALLTALYHMWEVPRASGYGGIYHMAGMGAASWFDFATAIFEEANTYGHPCPTVSSITTDDYPTPAKRPANSTLNCGKLDDNFCIQLPYWRDSMKSCIKKLLEKN
ncbi:NAD(P)-dependent oxidoreductase [Kordiimonas sediminis]|uniref:dTDP-4-dehydrorhamnose reductase n=1 Tax=Kordiimonas sediminis TaxID=1735581 RepID=A0A919APU0_9PROT|nr:dTDP-4-dehydrorhamnose reductase [Kordiimonas sediminis]GHF18554.1 NAD(P)-dependent oxidoreductase [Kordiimonas sediminis]